MIINARISSFGITSNVRGLSMKHYPPHVGQFLYIVLQQFIISRSFMHNIITCSDEYTIWYFVCDNHFNVCMYILSIFALLLTQSVSQLVGIARKCCLCDADWRLNLEADLHSIDDMIPINVELLLLLSSLTIDYTFPQIHSLPRFSSTTSPCHKCV